MQFRRAVRAEFVFIRHFPLALGAGRMKVVFAVRAEIKPRIHRGRALRTGKRQRFPNEQINNQSDQEITGRQD